MDRQTYGWMDGWVESMDGWMDGRTEEWLETN